MIRKTSFALFFGNRRPFPSGLVAQARKEIPEVLKSLGYDYLILDSEATGYGAVETPAEGQVYANFLEQNRGKFGGVILCLPNFGDGTGAVAALKEAGVPILIQAYPDELNKMSPTKIRDSFCGKISIMNLFVQYGIPFTNLPPHTVSPASQVFKEQIVYFDRVCRVANGLKNLTIGAIGARTTPFKTVRIDEVALQKNGITTETYDLSDVFKRMKDVNQNHNKYKAKSEELTNYAEWNNVPPEAFSKVTRLGVILDDMIEENKLGAIALRCWTELQEQLGISPCVLLSILNNNFLPAACEVDVGNAVAMYALQQASGQAAACLDWNNNYGDDENKCILFHCGPIPQAMMKQKGVISDNLIMAIGMGAGKSFGCNVGRIKPGPFTFSSMMTIDGYLRFYLGEGAFTDDPIPDDFFGCAGVAQIPKLQDVLLHVGYQGHKPHTSVTPSHVAAPLIEALTRYKGFEVTQPQKGGVIYNGKKDKSRGGTIVDGEFSIST